MLLRCWEVGTSHRSPVFGWVNIKLEECSPAGLALPYWEVFSHLGKRRGWGGVVLDSIHCWRGARQPRGLSPATGPGANSIRTTPRHRQRRFQLLGRERGCSPGEAGQRGGCSPMSSAQPTGSCIHHRDSAEAVRGGGDARWLPTASSHSFARLGFLNSPIHSAAYSPPGPAAPVSLPNCPLQGHGRHVGCGMQDAGRQPLIPAQLQSGERWRDCHPYVQWQGGLRGPS